MPESIIATYDYRNLAGKLLFQVLRLEPKAFRQRRPDGNGGWTWSLDGVERVPYRLTELLASSDDRVFIVEGEKDADALWQLGLVATTNAGGAGKWPADFAAYFKGRHVLILPDYDDPGWAHAEKVADNLQAVAASLKIVKLPGLTYKGDVTDWFAAGHTREELERIIEGTPFWEPPRPSVTIEREPEHLTDLGNAKRLVAKHGQDIRFCPHIGWFSWDGSRWNRDQLGEVRRRAKDTAVSVFAEAAAASGAAERKALAIWAAQSESEARIRAMISLAESEPGIPLFLNAFDADPWLLNCANGTIDLRTGALRPHRREDLISKITPVAYDPDAWPDRFLNFLAEILPDAELIEYLHRVFGYALTGDTREHVLHIFYGMGGNGKSTLLETIRAALGDYAQQAEFSSFLLKKHDSVRNDIARLVGARFVSAVEIEGGRRLAEVLVKTLTGGDTITARYLFKEFFEFKPQFKLVVAGNHKPRVVGTDLAIWRRLRLVPFLVTIPPEKQDRSLPEKLREELPGILRWFVQGCVKWQRDGLRPPPAVQAATEDYRQEMDVIGDFLMECCVQQPRATVTAKHLYTAYTQWCDEHGEEPLRQKGLGLRLAERGFTPVRLPNSNRAWRGIGLLQNRNSF